MVLTCGTPVAAYPVPGPIDVMTEEVGTMLEDLNQAIALTRDHVQCRVYAEGWSWEASATQFLACLVPSIGWKAEAPRRDASTAGALQH